MTQIRSKPEPIWSVTASLTTISTTILTLHPIAQIHGYDYKFYQALHKDGYYDTWILPSTLLTLLSNHTYTHVVTMDADVSITHPEIPLEWLFNRWGISKHTSIAMPWDVKEIGGPGEVKSVDGKGVQVLNTGLVVVQDLPYTTEMLEAWRDCPEEKRWPGCARWKQEWSHEQRAFSEFVRYEFNPDDDNIVTIPCDDAMSYPGMAAQYAGRIATDCNGTFFRHHTLNKEMAKGSVATSVMQLLYGMMQDAIRENKDDIWVAEKEGDAGLAKAD
ncbi:hypothetical protein DM02DRAFT_715656 [Periconia macrospinosa]|uniref:Nucleotide-diphospho-sugar transferase domain-containing protein n=1 Tax=Periconia macrospinosa TaxID=97972 RepID=A0A2V1E5H8_9PLEO|nr:hypothetical protein DM02DRAFT_715656 [Periconia macrospinosa]